MFVQAILWYLNINNVLINLKDGNDLKHIYESDKIYFYAIDYDKEYIYF